MASKIENHSLGGGGDPQEVRSFFTTFDKQKMLKMFQISQRKRQKETNRQIERGWNKR